jgi:hypothetical protein
MATTKDGKPSQPSPRRKTAAKADADELAPMTRGNASILAVETSEMRRAPVGVVLQKSEVEPTDDQALWVAIRNRTEAIGFNNYAAFLHRVLCNPPTEYQEFERDQAEELRGRLDLLPKPLHGVNAYQLLKAATESFLLLEAGIVINPATDPSTGGPTPTGEVPGLEETRFSVPPGDIQQTLEAYLVNHLGSAYLPYLKRIVQNLVGEDPLTSSPFCDGVLESKIGMPCLLELIWSYWHEEGMLVQALNAVSLRFQNKRGPGRRDSLAALEIDPLRPLNNLLWGYIQDERDRLTVSRRTYEYSHHYGLSLVGKAVPRLRPADSRSKFLQAFHQLLHSASVFYHDDADTTVSADGFPLLNSLKEAHMLLAEGAHNQFGDLPWTARVEMLIQQWLLSRREMKEFLRGRAMVPYKEAWMAQADTMKRLQGWSDTPVTQFRDLGVYGEQLLLSIRYGDWIDVNDQAHAKNWARYWKPEIQGYIHAYRAVTGVELGTDASRAEPVDATLPAIHLSRRMGSQLRAAR